MKKTISLFLLFLLVTSCFTFHASDANALGVIWVKEFYKDKFGDPTEKYYLTNNTQFKGTYNNDTVSEGTLGASLIFERDGENLLAYVTLFLNGKEQVKNGASSRDGYEVSVKRGDGSQFTTMGRMQAKEERIEIYNSLDLANALCADGGVVKVFIEEKYNENINYLFTVECGNFDALYNQEILVPYQEEKYQEAEQFLGEKKYDEAAEAFRALGDYKDSLTRLKEIIEKNNTESYAFTQEHYKDVDIVTFGRYEQDNNLENGTEPIEWLVLDVQDGRALLISKYGLISKPYHRKCRSVTWEICTLRHWLNGAFLAEAFTDEEQNDIVTLEVDNDISQGNNRWSTNGGRNTEDKVFLMSYAEAGIYFSSDNNRICRPTAYAKAQGTYVDDSGNCLWWLRSPGNTQEYTADVNADGSLGSNRYVHYDDVTVRPAMWVNMETGASFATTNR